MAEYTANGFLPKDGLTFVQPGDLEAIAVATDFVGINYYNRAIMRDAGASDNLPPTENQRDEMTAMNWEVYPEGLYDTLMRVHTDYAPRQIYITENGASYSDGPNANGVVADERRTSYLHRHLAAAHRAIQNGVPLAGYFAWSLMDNFEWAKGYAQRFGLVWVDFETQQRIVKDSGKWYAQVIARNGLG